MSKIVFFTWPGGGNQPPAIGLAQQLRRAGHDIVVAGYADQATRFEALGLEFVTLTRSGGAWDAFDPADLMPILIGRIWATPDHVADTGEILDHYQPDLVVVDCLMGVVLAAMETRPIPTMVLVHSSPGALAPPGGPIDQMVLPHLNRIRATLNLEPVDSHWHAWERHQVICASIPELDPLDADSLPQATWVGPVFEEPIETDWTPDRHAATPLVLVSFSSGPAWDQTSRIQRTIDGLAAAGIRAIVTTGAVEPNQLENPSEAITVVAYLPHDAILPYAAAVVTHAGHGTLAAALAHGLPIVAIPNLAADQPALAEQVAQLGAGIHLHEDTTPADIARAVQTVIDDPAYSRSSRALADRIDAYRGQARITIEHALENAAHTRTRERS
jgi:UDP:flavonoid glycosyltransferase YjiC (YdhE family)